MKAQYGIERWLLRGMFLMFLVIAGALLWRQMPVNGPQTAAASEKQQLSTPEMYLPQNLPLGEPPFQTDFTEADGTGVTLSRLTGKPALLLFWASWCGACKQQFSIAAEIEKLAQQYETRIVLVGQLDAQKGTQQAALDEWKTLGINWPLWFDEDRAAYKAWGLSKLPTAVLLDERSRVCAYASGVLTAGEYRGLFQDGMEGAGKATAAFVKEKMTGPDGGVYINAKDLPGTPDGHAFLSETQGLLMQYAVQTGDQALFDRTLTFVRTRLQREGLTAWYMERDGTRADTNAALDDLRLYDALDEADVRWGGYAGLKAEIRQAVYSGNTKTGRLISFCNLDTHRKDSSLALCYADFEVLNQMAEEDARFESVAQNTRIVVQNGYISDDFPLYYSTYEETKKSYTKEDLNTAEALFTLWHLSRDGALFPESLAWLKAKVLGQGLAARYHVDGTAVPGYDYHSTAVYALAALIAAQENDTLLYNAAVQKMERLRVRDADSAFYGGFGTEETGDFPAFDQCLPLLVYAAQG